MQERDYRVRLAFTAIDQALGRVRTCEHRSDGEGAGIAAAEATVWCFAALDIITDEGQVDVGPQLAGLRYLRDRVAHQASNPAAIFDYAVGTFGSPSPFGGGEPLGTARPSSLHWQPLRKLPKPHRKVLRGKKQRKKQAELARKYTEQVAMRPVAEVLGEACEELHKLWAGAQTGDEAEGE